MSRLDPKEHPILIGDRTFKLVEMTNRRIAQVEDMGDEETILKQRLTDCKDPAERKKLRQEIRANEANMYRSLLFPVHPPTPPDDEWLADNIGAGYLEAVILPQQQILNRHQDVLGGNIPAQEVQMPGSLLTGRTLAGK